MKRIKKIFKGGKQLEKIMHGRLEVRLETGMPRLEITEKSIRFSGVSDMVNISALLAQKIYSKSIEFDHFEFSSAISASAFAYYNTGSYFDFSILRFPALKNGNNMFYWCRRALGFPLVFPSLETGIGMFFNCPLNSEDINTILENLPTWADGKPHVITFTHCPGAATCSPEIAASKGWTVEI